MATLSFILLFILAISSRSIACVFSLYDFPVPSIPRGGLLTSTRHLASFSVGWMSKQKRLPTLVQTEHSLSCKCSVETTPLRDAPSLLAFRTRAHM
jgi:hypothetical protein